MAPKCNQLEFHYQGIKQTPPDNNYSRWIALVAEVVQHAIDRYPSPPDTSTGLKPRKSLTFVGSFFRYGLTEVQNWNFEVWNELWGMPFPDDYMRLYNASVTIILPFLFPSLISISPCTVAPVTPQHLNYLQSTLFLPSFEKSCLNCPPFTIDHWLQSSRCIHRSKCKKRYDTPFLFHVLSPSLVYSP